MVFILFSPLQAIISWSTADVFSHNWVQPLSVFVERWKSIKYVWCSTHHHHHHFYHFSNISLPLSRWHTFTPLFCFAKYMVWCSLNLSWRIFFGKYHRLFVIRLHRVVFCAITSSPCHNNNCCLLCLGRGSHC